MPSIAAPRATVVALSAICMMSAPENPCAYAQEVTPDVTEEPEPTDVSFPNVTEAPTDAPTRRPPVLRPGRWIRLVLRAIRAIIAGNFFLFLVNPGLLIALIQALQNDFGRGLQGRSRRRVSRRQEDEDELLSWDVVVSNLTSINNNTELEFNVEGTQTRYAEADEVVVVAPSQALQDFNELFDFSKSSANTPMQELDTLYTETTGESVPRGAFFLSRVTVDQTVSSDVFLVTDAPEVARGSSLNHASIIVPSVLGCVCLSALLALAAVALVRRRREREADTTSSENEPYANDDVAKGVPTNPLGTGGEANAEAFSPVAATKAEVDTNPYRTETY